MLYLLMSISLVFLIAGSWIHIKAQAAQWLLQEAWQQTREDGMVHKPWSWADHWPVVRLSVPSMKIDQIVLAGDSGNVLAFAPGHSQQSRKPGEGGTVVISGHRDTHFRFLQYLHNGEVLNLETPFKSFAYQVTGSSIVDVNTTRIDVDAGSDQLLLVTCYPFDSPVAGGPLRYVIAARPVSI